MLNDHEMFSNALSRHLCAPHGMDSPVHCAYRRILDPYFAPECVNGFEPVCRNIVTALVQDAVARGEAEVMTDLALPFAVRVQCAFLGWPPSLHEKLGRWIRKSHEATRSQDQQALAEVAHEFDDVIDAQLDTRREAGDRPEDDVTGSLMHEHIDGRTLTREEIASIVRNWTAGEVGIRICPCPPLARMDLRVFIDELLAHTARIGHVAGETPVHAKCPPAVSLPLMVR